MSPMDPRLNTLKNHALMWERSVDWFDEPDEISLEIIPPTHWPETYELAGAGIASSAAIGLAYAPVDANRDAERDESRGRDPATECRALAFLAAALLHAVEGR